MNRYLFIIATTLMVVIASGCTNLIESISEDRFRTDTNSNSNSNSDVYVPSDTDIVNRNSGEIENENRLKEFIQNTEKGKKDSIRVVAYTKEGDPILTDLVFNKGELEVTHDNTRDEYGVGGIETFQCEKVEVEGKKYMIIGCEGYDYSYYLAERF